ncbi:MAG: hypothetical protein K2P81_09115 [Bacteriovoracaceae bacterium]|nr:hypothetical protein [Bacteriovoracaceae bacterium]
MKNIFYALLLVAFPSMAQVTVSGLSSGAYFAHQLHVAYSSEISGAGILAGGPFWCARGNVNTALNTCMDTAGGAPRTEDSIDEALRRESDGRIDELKNLSKSKVYILSGTADRTVLPVMSQRLASLYKKWGVKANDLKFENSLSVGHAFPTLNFGNPCEDPSSPPYISNCARDIAGEMLNHLIGPLKNKKAANSSRVFSFPQAHGLDPAVLSLAKTGFAYVPVECESKESNCQLHVAFHGCRQTIDDVGMDYVMNTGYNAWAESNKVVILYPQAVRNFFLGNPRGCWDWWGYTGPLYHTKDGPQMRMIARVIELWRSKKLNFKKFSGDL